MFCCSLYILVVHVMFTNLYISEHKFNNIKNIFGVIVSWSGWVSILLVMDGSCRVEIFAGQEPLTATSLQPTNC